MAQAAKKRTYHVYSKMTSSVTYPLYEKPEKVNAAEFGGKVPVQIPRLLHSVTINGGAGIANKFLVTPLGVHTEISQEDMEALNQSDVFKLHRDNGFILVTEGRQIEVEKALADMTGDADPSAPLSPADFHDPGSNVSLHA